MNSASTIPPVSSQQSGSSGSNSGVSSSAVLARQAGFLADLSTVARRALKGMVRDKEAVIPPLIIGAFFFVVNVGTLQKLGEQFANTGNYKAFQLPPAVIFAVTGLSRAGSLVSDIQSGYFDRMLATPIKRVTLLLGLMMADFVLACALTIPILVVAALFGVSFTTGPIGILVFILVTGLWGLAFTGFSYAIALKTANPAAVNSAFLIFFPFAFITTTTVPKESMTGWLQTLVTINPVTYLLEGMRSLITEGWSTKLFGTGFAIAGVFAVGFGLAFTALRGRVSRR
jgi:ABC-2 type transport system permease protein